MDFGGLRELVWFHINVDILFFFFSVQTLCLKKNTYGGNTNNTRRIHSEPDGLWRIVTDHPDIFDSLIVPKLNGNDVKFFYDVNTESRVAIKRSSGGLCATFEICDFFHKI